MATAEERLNEWLRDAHAAEEQAHSMLTGAAGHLDDYPEFKTRLHQHGELSERQAQLLKECLSTRGESTSLIKGLAGKVIALGQTVSGLVVGDEVVKAALAIATFTQMEVASYRILIAAAETVGDGATRQICERILAEEEEFARWLDQQLGPLTSQYLGRREAPSAAKH